MKNAAENIPLVPSDFIVKEVIIENAFGQAANIENLVGYFNISSNIYFAGMVLRVGILDAAQFWKLFNLNGQEKITLKFRTRKAKSTPDSFKDSEVTLKFRVIKFPEFAKRDDSAMSVNYELLAIEEQNFYSKLSSISKSVSGQISNIIRNILIKDLNYPENQLIFSNALQTAFRGVLPWNTPLKHCDFLRKRLVSKEISPAFLFSSIVNDIQTISLKSLFEIKEEGVYETYVWNKEYQHARYSWADFREQQIRIINLTSQLGFSRFGQSQAGAFASNNNFFDLQDGSFKTYNFDYFEDGGVQRQIIEEHSIFDTDEFPLNKQVNAHKRFETVNSGQNSIKRFNENDNYSILTEKQLHKLRSSHELLSTCRHDFITFGDINLQPGKIINLTFPNTGENRDSDAELIDEKLSGDYLVIGTIHSFDQNGKYFVHVKAQREANPS